MAGSKMLGASTPRPGTAGTSASLFAALASQVVQWDKRPIYVPNGKLMPAPQQWQTVEVPSCNVWYVSNQRIIGIGRESPNRIVVQLFRFYGQTPGLAQVVGDDIRVS